jgi:hypothetical protein
MLNYFYKVINNKKYIEFGITNLSELSYKIKFNINSLTEDDIIKIKGFLLNINNINIEKYREKIIKCIEKILYEKNQEELLEIDYILFDIENGIASIPLLEIIINRNDKKDSIKNYNYYRFMINKVYI